MNIKEAKKQIKEAAGLYFKKDSNGQYILPLGKQRPFFLLGSPGVGKTAIMSQIAEELGVAYVSYSMTHHTRQSALGLPVICHESYEGMDYDISRYTMSEIIASVYDEMKKTGKKEGILFLDEINCVSETLSPAMLLFLQYKIFGSYKLPEGWMIVTAGNPPEYNRQVREFDVVTLDRMRVLDIEADYDSFREYAIEQSVHPAVISYLDEKKDHFYKVENTVEGKRYVTARGWEDLSSIIKLSEKENIVVDINTVKGFLRDEQIAGSFMAYYELYDSYRRKLPVAKVLDGEMTDEECMAYRSNEFDEKIIVISILTEQLRSITSKVNAETERLVTMSVKLKEKEQTSEEEANNLSNLKVECKLLAIAGTKKLSNVFSFMDRAYGDDGSEMTLFMTGISLDKDISGFIARFGNEEYNNHASKLQISGRGELLKEKCKQIIEGI